MKYSALIPVLLLLAGCSSVQRDTPLQVWDDMKHQQKFKAQAPVAGIFEDGRSNRLLPEDTVARDNYFDASPYSTGLDNGMYVGKNPVPVTLELLEQGQTKFNIYCSPCHDQTGMGHGIVPAHVPTWQPSNLTEDRVVQFADGDIFNVITNGRRTMPSYRYQVVIADRWAIVAYVRALQRAAHSKPDEVPAGTTIAALK
ncbi:MAG: cytochrome c [Acidobacteriota bacterium]|nr:cytochrome c [Acidobacteriota bacterium]